MNDAIERNALLEVELDEKESLQAMVQRLKDEISGKQISISNILVSIYKLKIFNYYSSIELKFVFASNYMKKNSFFSTPISSL